MQEKKMKIISSVLAAVLCGACFTSCGGQAAVSSSEYMGESSSAVASEPESKPESKPEPESEPADSQSRPEFTEADAEAANARRSGTTEYTRHGEMLTGWGMDPELDAFCEQYEEQLWNQEPIPKTVVAHFADIPGLEVRTEMQISSRYGDPDVKPIMREITFGGKRYNVAKDFSDTVWANSLTGIYGPEVDYLYCKNWVALRIKNKAVVFFEGGCQEIQGLTIMHNDGRSEKSARVLFEYIAESDQLLCYRTCWPWWGEDTYDYLADNIAPETVMETVSILTVENGKLKEAQIQAHGVEQFLRKYDGDYEDLLEFYQCRNYIELGEKQKELWDPYEWRKGFDEWLKGKGIIK